MKNEESRGVPIWQILNFRCLQKLKKALVKQCFARLNSRIQKNLMKLMENEDFWVPFSKNDQKMIKKALPREGFRDVFSKRRNPLWNQRKTLFLKSQKRVAETLIKPVENEDFWAPFPKMTRNDQKALRL